MKVLFVATVVKTHIMQFHVPYLKMFKEMGWDTAVAARNDYEDKDICNIPWCDFFYDIPFGRNPLNLNNLRAYKQLKKVIDDGKYDIIHCHTPVGAALTRLAARTARDKGSKVIYTAHGFHFYEKAPIKNWLVYYPIERILSKYTDVLITINKEDYERAKTKFKAVKTEYVPGVGIDTTLFNNNCSDILEKRLELGVPSNAFVILSVGELIKRKNHVVVLRALAELKKKRVSDNIFYLVCGSGVLSNELQSLARKLQVEDHVLFLGYRKDIAEICNASNIFAFMSYQEGLPVAMMEAMACGLPVICSNIRGNVDLVKNGSSGLIVENSSKAIADAIIKLHDSEELCSYISENALYAIKKFDIKNVQKKMKDIYLELITSK